MISDAYISNCKEYRYWLSRVWNDALPVVVWLMCNPSTATAFKDDATIRKCISYSRKWGYGGIVVINMYALRSRDPLRLWKVKDPIGPHNDRWISIWCNQAFRTGAPIVCAWSRYPTRQRVNQILRLTGEQGITLQALQLGKHGPNHPLYLKGNLKPVLFLGKSK